MSNFGTVFFAVVLYTHTHSAKGTIKGHVVQVEAKNLQIDVNPLLGPLCVGLITCFSIEQLVKKCRGIGPVAIQLRRVPKLGLTKMTRAAECQLKLERWGRIRT